MVDIIHLQPYQTRRRNRPSQRQRRARRAARHNKEQDFLAAWNPLNLPTTDWPEEEETYGHCPECHFNHELTDRSWCQYKFPGLDQDTCPICNTWNPPNPAARYPLLRLVENPLNPYLIKVVHYFDTFDYLPFRLRVLLYFPLLIIALVLARLV